MADDVRSGDRVLNTTQQVGALMALVSPFITGGVLWLQAHLRYTDLGAGYTEVVKTALAIYLPTLIARYHMRRIRQADADADVSQRILSLHVPEEPPSGSA